VSIAGIRDIVASTPKRILNAVVDQLPAFSQKHRGSIDSITGTRGSSPVSEVELESLPLKARHGSFAQDPCTNNSTSHRYTPRYDDGIESVDQELMALNEELNTDVISSATISKYPPVLTSEAESMLYTLQECKSTNERIVDDVSVYSNVDV